MSDILIIQRIFSKYRKDILDELHQHTNFILIHSKNKSGIKQVSTPYSKRVSSLKYSGKETNLFLNVFPYIIKSRPKIVIHEFSLGILSLIPTYYLTRLLGIKFILWGHGYDRTKGFYPEKSLLDKIRLFLIKKADAVILYGQEAKLLISEYVECDKVYVAYNCLNTNILNALRDKLETEGRAKVKKRIGFIHEYNIIFIGRILKTKQPQLLIDIFEYLENQYGNSLCIHFVGDGDYLYHIKEIVKNKGIENNFNFYGAIHDDIKNAELLYCSDLMVMPGYVGLSVNHAFNFDCPVVTFEQNKDGPYHSPEIEYLINEKTGFIVKSHSAEALAIIIGNYLERKDIQNQMKLNIRNMIENTCSINNFVKGFQDAIAYVLKIN